MTVTFHLGVTDLVEQVAPALNAFMKRVAEHPAVVAYYAKFAA